jgi:hypothetical protein
LQLPYRANQEQYVDLGSWLQNCLAEPQMQELIQTYFDLKLKLSTTPVGPLGAPHCLNSFMSLKYNTMISSECCVAIYKNGSVCLEYAINLEFIQMVVLPSHY